jgi:hypothetical protein
VETKLHDWIIAITAFALGAIALCSFVGMVAPPDAGNRVVAVFSAAESTLGRGLANLPLKKLPNATVDKQRVVSNPDERNVLSVA